MNFNEHSHIKGKHALLGASRYHWLNYDQNKLLEYYSNFKAAERGTQLHEFASQCIKLSQKLPRTKQTLNMFVNDAIGYGMNTEQVLYYSDNCYGTADAISFRNNILRIHDYKSGVTPAKMEQLKIYTGIFCLEYNIQPAAIKIELRIYQMDEILYHKPEVDEIVPIIDKIITFDNILNKLQKEEGLL